MPDVAPGVTTRTAVSTRAAGVSEETSEHELASVRTMLTEVQRARSAWTDSVRWVDALVSAVVGRRRGDGADDCQRAEAGRGRLNGGAGARRKRAPGVRLAPGRTPGAGAAPRLAPLRETGQRVEGATAVARRAPHCAKQHSARSGPECRWQAEAIRHLDVSPARYQATSVNARSFASATRARTRRVSDFCRRRLNTHPRAPVEFSPPRGRGAWCPGGG